MTSMRSIMQLNSTVLFALLSFCVFGVQADNSHMTNVLSQLETYANSQLQSSGVPGLAYAVIKDDQLVYAKGFGVKDTQTNEAVDENTAFEIGSTSKAFTAALMAMLIDEGKVALDDPVRKHYKNFRMYDSWVTDQFQVVDLMSQHSGMSGYALDSLAIMLYPESAILGALRYVKPVTSFRSAYAYQNTLWNVAGKIVEKLNGDEWGNLVKNKIFTPLGMSRSTANPYELQSLGNAARGFVPQSDGSLFRVPDNWPYNKFLKTYAPAGGICSTVVDLAKWVRMQLANGTFEGNRLISAESVNSMHVPRTYISETDTSIYSYANGWLYQSRVPAPIIWHNGSTLSMHSIVALIPDANLGLVVLTNTSGNKIPENMMEELFRLYYGIQSTSASELQSIPQLDKFPGFKDKLTVMKGKALSKASSTRYIGRYKNPGCGVFRVFRRNGSLLVRITSGNLTAELAPSGGNFELMAPDYPTTIGQVRFVIGADGTARQLIAEVCKDVNRGVFRRVD